MSFFTRRASAVSAFVVAAMLGGTHSVLAQEAPEAPDEATLGNTPVEPSQAMPAPVPPAPKPWNEGISSDNLEKAKGFFLAGNDHYKNSKYTEALKEYRLAFEIHPNHPGVLFNMARSLIYLGQPIEAHKHLEAAMKHGAAAFDEALFKEGQAYMKLLLGQLARVRIVSKEKGAKISLDGEELFIGPGETTLIVKPARHQIVASKAEMLTLTQEIVPTAGGEENLIELKMLPLSAGVVMKRRWKNWKPWAVTGAGLGVAALGVPFYFLAQSNADSYDAQVASQCPGPDGCNAMNALPGSIADLKSRAELQDIAAVSLFVAGGAVALTGVVMVFINRPTAHQLEADPRENKDLLDARNVSIAPILGGGRSGVMTNYSLEF